MVAKLCAKWVRQVCDDLQLVENHLRKFF